MNEEPAVDTRLLALGDSITRGPTQCFLFQNKIRHLMDTLIHKSFFYIQYRHLVFKQKRFLALV